MKSLISKLMASLAVCITLLSFSAKPGGEGFEIYLGSKLVLQRYGVDINTVQHLQLNQHEDDKLFIKYHHCGKAGKNRIITIMDEQHKTLKEFSYADAKSPGGVMVLDIKEVYKLKKGSSNLFQLYYSSSELTAGRLLTNITL